MNSSGAEGSVKSLKQQLREAQAEVAAMADKFGETSVQAAEAAKRAAQLKDRIGDAKALTDAFNPDKKFQAFSSALSGVAGGFAAVQGAMGLMGAESKDIEKTLLKVQSAMALSQGLSAVTESIDAFKNLKVVAVNALNSIKTAIGSTGIGLLVVALGAIYTYWDDIKGAVSGVSEEQEKLNKQTKKNLDAQKEKLKTINSQDNVLKLQGKSEKDILKLKIQQYDSVIKATEASIVQAEITQKTQVAASKRNKEILEGLLNFLSLPITAILFAVDKIKNAVGQTSTLLQDYKSSLAKMVFNPEEVQSEGDKVIKEQKDALNTLKNDRAGFQLQIQAIDKEAAKKSKESSDNDKKQKEQDAKQLEQETQRLLKEREANRLTQELHTEQLIQDSRLALIKDANLKRIQEIENARQLEIDKELDALSKGLITQEQYNINRQAIDDKFNVQRDQQEAIRLQKIKDNAEAQKKIDEEQYQAKIKLTKDVGDAMGVLSEVIGKETAVGKALAVSQATINTFLGATEVLRAKSVLPEPFGTISKVVNVATIIGTGIKSIKSILSTKVPGAAGGGGSVPSGLSATAAPIGTQMGATALQQAQINAAGNAAVQAFVLESDVSGNQERIERLNRAARIQ